MDEKLQRCRRSMAEVLELEDVPEIEEETETLKHMRINKLVALPDSNV